MALTLVKSPAAVSLVGNDILFKINTDNQYSVNGVNAVLGCTWPTVGDDDGDSFTLSWGNNEITFLCLASENYLGTRYPPHTAGTLAAWVESLIPYFERNYLINFYFDLTWNGAQEAIVFTAKNKGSEYTMALTPNTSNINEDLNTAGVDAVARFPYNIIAMVYLSGETEDILLGEDRFNPDEDGNVIFRIQEYLKSNLSFHFEWPESTTTFLFKKEEIIKAYYIKYAQFWDDTVKWLFTTKATTTYALLGGIDRATEGLYNEEETTWWAKFLYKYDFLTNQPRELYVSKHQPVKLSFLVWKDVSEINLKIKVIFTDASTQTLTKTIASVQYEVFESILSYQKLGLGSLSTKDILKYEVWMEDQDDNRISISRYFYIDEVYRENERIFIFQNSLGSADVVRFTGISENSIEVDRTSMERIQQEGFTWRNFEIEDYENLEVQKFAFNSGWLNELAIYPKQFADYLREFYRSPKIYELINNRLYPTRITSKKQFISRSDESMINIEFEAERAYTDKYFSQDENVYPSTGFESKFIPNEFLNPE